MDAEMVRHLLEEEVSGKWQGCYEENQNLLGQTKDFIYAMTDFLNSQSGEADTRLLETYKDTLLKTIRKESVL